MGVFFYHGNDFVASSLWRGMLMVLQVPTAQGKQGKSPPKVLRQENKGNLEFEKTQGFGLLR